MSQDIYVRNDPNSTCEQEIQNLFVSFGKVGVGARRDLSYVYFQYPKKMRFEESLYKGIIHLHVRLCKYS